MEKIIQLLRSEKELFSLLADSLSKQKEAMIEKDIDAMNEYLRETERIASEIDKVDAERHRLFSELKLSLELPIDASLEMLLKALPVEEAERLEEAIADFLLTLNDVAGEIHGLKEILDFENAYFEFLMNLASGSETKDTYSIRGESRAVQKNNILDVRW